jgi:2-phospho-L-lactate guanylyltransferase
MVLVPVKAFGRAKHRLARQLDPARRADLARRMAEGVIAAAGDLPVAVVHDDEGIATWARSLGARAIRQRGEGLDAAVTTGVSALAASGAERIIVAHSDLPLARDLRWVGDTAGITLVPDRHGQGTNVLALPPDLGFRFSYGTGSFHRHREEAHRLGEPVRIVFDHRLSWDVDEPADLAALDAPVSIGGPL